MVAKLLKRLLSSDGKMIWAAVEAYHNEPKRTEAGRYGVRSSYEDMVNMFLESASRLDRFALVRLEKKAALASRAAEKRRCGLEMAAKFLMSGEFETPKAPLSSAAVQQYVQAQQLMMQQQLTMQQQAHALNYYANTQAPGLLSQGF